MPKTDPLTIADLLVRLRSGALTPSVVAETVLARVDADPAAVWITRVDPEQVRAAATRLDEKPPDLPLYGVPFAVKDNIDVAGMPTTAGCPGFAYVPDESAFVVHALEAAGALLIGKTNMDQFATGLVGTRSPYGVSGSVLDDERVSGGSSSGSALAVARGLVAFSLGTDTAGSGRIPAAFNGIVGLKPTRGTVSTRGVVPACASLDCVSVFAHTARDARAVLEVIAGVDREDPYTRPRPVPIRAPRGRLGVPRLEQLGFEEAEAEAAWGASVEASGTLGWEVVDVDVTPLLGASPLLYRSWVAERAHDLAGTIASEPVGLDPAVAQIVLGGREIRAVDAFGAMHELAELRRRASGIWDEVDVLLMPTAPEHPTRAAVGSDPIGVNERLGRYTNFCNLMDLAAVAVPGPGRADGLPFGVTIVGPAGQDEMLLALAGLWQGEPDVAGVSGFSRVAVVGAHLSGLPLNGQITALGGHLACATETASRYRFFALPGGPPARPALARAPEGEGVAIACEVWTMPTARLGDLLAQIPAPLGLGRVELADGEVVHGFIAEAGSLGGAQDISEHGGWRAYLTAGAD